MAFGQIPWRCWSLLPSGGTMPVSGGPVLRRDDDSDLVAERLEFGQGLGHGFDSLRTAVRIGYPLEGVKPVAQQRW